MERSMGLNRKIVLKELLILIGRSLGLYLWYIVGAWVLGATDTVQLWVPPEQFLTFFLLGLMFIGAGIVNFIIKLVKAHKADKYKRHTEDTEDTETADER